MITERRFPDLQYSGWGPVKKSLKQNTESNFTSSKPIMKTIPKPMTNEVSQAFVPVNPYISENLETHYYDYLVKSLAKPSTKLASQVWDLEGNTRDIRKKEEHLSQKEAEAKMLLKVNT